MKNTKLQDLLNSNRFTLLLSFVLAVTAWVVVVAFFSTGARTTIEDVPVDVGYNASYLNLDLEIIEKEFETVDVVVTGPRSVIGNLTKEDIIVYPQFSNVRVAGKYSLALNAVKSSAVMEYQIESLSSYQIGVRFDQVIEKTLPLNIDASNIKIPTEFMVDKIYATPENVTIKGPATSVNKVSKIVATVEEQEVTQSTVLPAALVLYDINGEVVNDSYVSFEQEEYTVTVPVLSEIILPVKVDFINVPSGFDTATLKTALSLEEIQLGVPTRIAEGLTEHIAGYIDLKTLKFDQPYVFDVSLSGGFKNLKDVEQISVTVSSEGMSAKTISVSEIKVLNQGQQTIEVITDVINNVEIVGKTEVLEQITDGSAVAQIDMSKVALAQGQQTIDVEIIIPSTDQAFVRGTYTVTIKN